MTPRKILIRLAPVLLLAGGLAAGLQIALGNPGGPATTTPIEHLVVIYEENATFDHYFATYPHALNPPGESTFTPRPGTPAVNGLNETLLQDNPNAVNPRRLDRSQALTCDQDHHYRAEQEAYDEGRVDLFVQHTSGEECDKPAPGFEPTTVMDYFDGNTVTALWNYAQYYALEENSFGTQYGPSTPGHLNLISGETGGATETETKNGSVINGSLIANAYPLYDDCIKDGEGLPGGVSGVNRVSMSGRNVGDLLGAKGVTWGWFQGGFTPTARNAEGIAECRTAHTNIGAAKSYADYLSYHEPFQYYASTANPHHLPPTSVSAVGHSDQANHQYDLSYFTAALDEGNLPAVSFIKPPAYEDGHPGYSDPLDEQRFLVETINAIEQSPEWPNTAVVIAWDDSDGWYDHVMPPLVRPSESVQDALDGPGKCGVVPNPPPPAYQPDRCGYGPRLPMLVISPWARENYVDGTLTDQSSILRFIEDNWQLGRIGGDSSDAQAGTLENAFDFELSAPRAPKVILDETTGQVISVSPSDGDEQSTTSASTSTSATTTSTNHGGSGSHPGAGPRPGKGFACTLTPRGRHGALLTCRFSRTLKLHGRTSVRLRLERHGRLLATVRVFLHDYRATAVLRMRTSPHGAYTLRIVLASPTGVRGFLGTVAAH